MNELSEHERQVRRFLLGQVEEHERQQLERTLMVNAEYREQVLIIEENLIEDYLDGILQPDEHKAFEVYFLATHQQQLRVKFAKILGDLSSAESFNSDQLRPLTSPQRRWSFNLGIGNHPVAFTTLAAILLLVVALGVVQGIRLWRERSALLEATKQHSEIEQEFVRLNNPLAQNLPAATRLLTLAPITLRDARDTTSLPVPLPAEVIELRLLLTGNIYASYGVELNKTGAAEKFSVDGLRSQATASGQVVVVRLPSRMLRQGGYKLSLIGISDDNNKANAAEYHFEVGS